MLGKLLLGDISPKCTGGSINTCHRRNGDPWSVTPAQTGNLLVRTVIATVCKKCSCKDIASFFVKDEPLSEVKIICIFFFIY